MSKYKKHTDEEFNQIYKDVIKLVKTGQNIRNAIESLGYSSAIFYRRIKISEKLELQNIKAANAKYGVVQGGRYVQIEKDILALNNEY